MKYVTISDLNLSDSEKAVLAVLKKQKLGQTVSKIAENAGIPRTTADYILRKFKKWKVARQIRVEKQHYWLYNEIT